MGTYISMNATLIVSDAENAKKIIYDTTLANHQKSKPYQEMTIKEILKKNFDTYMPDNGTYDIAFTNECSYSWPEEIETMFKKLMPYLKDGSQLTIESDDDGGWYESYEIKNGKLLSGECHDFFTDDSGSPSDDEIADAIIRAAEILKTDPSKKAGLNKKFSSAASVQGILDILPS